jgi:hypothetical protein
LLSKTIDTPANGIPKLLSIKVAVRVTFCPHGALGLVREMLVVCILVTYVLTAEFCDLYRESPAKCAWYVHPVPTVVGAVPVKTPMPLLFVVWPEGGLTAITPVPSNVTVLPATGVPEGTPGVVSVMVAVKEVGIPHGTVPLDAATPRNTV